MNQLKSKISHWSKQHLTSILSSTLILLLAAGYFWFKANSMDTPPEYQQARINPIKLDYGPTQALPDKVELDADKVALGERLFHDTRLSGDNSIGCFSCHDLSNGGADGRPRSVGVNGGLSDVNAPTVFNSGFNFSQFWNGRAATLEDQIEGPIHNPKEMASNWPQIIAKLADDKTYLEQFKKLYRSGLSPDSVKDAIATFERSLVTPNSRFDQFLRGNANALSEQEKRGHQLFQSYGCASCHQGINFGGNMYEKMGLIGDYFADRGNVTEADKGRFNITHNPEHLHEFKVPGLRNVARTAPYFHDAYAETLPQAVAIMARYQLGRTLPQEEIDAITAFLTSLTGEYKGKAL